MPKIKKKVVLKLDPDSVKEVQDQINKLTTNACNAFAEMGKQVRESTKGTTNMQPKIEKEVQQFHHLERYLHILMNAPQKDVIRIEAVKKKIDTLLGIELDNS